MKLRFVKRKDGAKILQYQEKMVNLRSGEATLEWKDVPLVDEKGVSAPEVNHG